MQSLLLGNKQYHIKIAIKFDSSGLFNSMWIHLTDCHAINRNNCNYSQSVHVHYKSACLSVNEWQGFVYYTNSNTCNASILIYEDSPYKIALSCSEIHFTIFSSFHLRKKKYDRNMLVLHIKCFVLFYQTLLFCCIKGVIGC